MSNHPIRTPPLPPPPVYSLADFELIKPITKGAYGRILLVRPRKARQITSNLNPTQLYAMKVLHRSGITESKVQKRLILEFDILEKLSLTKSDYIVKLQCSFQTKQNFYLVMEYQPGGDLFSLLASFGYFDENVAKQYIAEIILAVDFLHQHNVVHCDLKPDNLLIGADGHLRLTDFGLSFNAMFTAVESGLIPDKDSSPQTQLVKLPSSKDSLNSKHKKKLSHDDARFASLTFDQSPSQSNTSSKSRLFGSIRHERRVSVDYISEKKDPIRYIRSPSPTKLSKHNSVSPLRQPSHLSTSSGTTQSPKNRPYLSPLMNLTQTESSTEDDESSEEEEEDEEESEASSVHVEEKSHPKIVNIKGTPDYIAPEIIEGDEYALTFTVDWWAVGIILVELLCGTTPFNAPTREEVYDNIITNDIETILPEILPEEVSEDARSLIKALLTKDPVERLGTNGGVKEIQNHSFFADLDWNNIYEMEPPFKPDFDESTFGMEYFEARDERFPVKAITTDDVSEDIRNARKERALQLFNAKHSERKMLAKARKRKPTFKVYGNIISIGHSKQIEPATQRRTSKSQKKQDDKLRNSKFYVSEIPRYRERKKSAAKSNQKPKIVRQSSKNDVFKCEPIPLAHRLMGASTLNEPTPTSPSQSATQGRQNRSHTFASSLPAQEGLSRASVFAPVQPNNKSPMLGPTHLLPGQLPKPSSFVQFATPAPLPPKTTAKRSSHARSHSFTDQKQDKPPIARTKTIETTKPMTALQTSLSSEVARSLPLTSSNTHTPTQQYSSPSPSTDLDLNQAQTDQKIRMVEDSTETIASDFSESCSCTSCSSFSPTIDTQDHSSTLTSFSKSHPPVLVRQTHHPGNHSPSLDNVSIPAQSFPIETKPDGMTSIAATYVDHFLISDTHTPPEFNIPSSLPLISQQQFLSSSEQYHPSVSYSSADSLTQTPSEAHSEVADLHASTSLLPDGDMMGMDQFMSNMDYNRMRSATIAGPMGSDVFGFQYPDLTRSTPHAKRKREAAVVEEPKGGGLKKNKKRRRKRHHPSCKHFKTDLTHNQSKNSISQSSQFSDDRFRSLQSSSSKQLTSSSLLVDLSDIPAPNKQKQSFGIVLDANDASIVSQSPLFAISRQPEQSKGSNQNMNIPLTTADTAPKRAGLWDVRNQGDQQLGSIYLDPLQRTSALSNSSHSHPHEKKVVFSVDPSYNLTHGSEGLSPSASFQSSSSFVSDATFDVPGQHFSQAYTTPETTVYSSLRNPFMQIDAPSPVDSEKEWKQSLVVNVVDSLPPHSSTTPQLGVGRLAMSTPTSSDHDQFDLPHTAFNNGRRVRATYGGSPANSPVFEKRPTPSPPPPFMGSMRSSSVIHQPIGTVLTPTPPLSVTPITSERDSVTPQSLSKYEEHSPQSGNFFGKMMRKAKQKIKNRKSLSKSSNAMLSPNSPFHELISPRGSENTPSPTITHPTIDSSNSPLLPITAGTILSPSSPQLASSFDGKVGIAQIPTREMSPHRPIPEFPPSFQQTSTLKQTFVNFSAQNSPNQKRESSSSPHDEDSPFTSSPLQQALHMPLSPTPRHRKEHAVQLISFSPTHHTFTVPLQPVFEQPNITPNMETPQATPDSLQNRSVEPSEDLSEDLDVHIQMLPSPSSIPFVSAIPSLPTQSSTLPTPLFPTSPKNSPVFHTVPHTPPFTAQTHQHPGGPVFASPFQMGPMNTQNSHPEDRNYGRVKRSQSFLSMSSYLKSHPLSFTATQPSRRPSCVQPSNPSLPVGSQKPL